jgi:hypothetical protein
MQSDNMTITRQVSCGGLSCAQQGFVLAFLLWGDGLVWFGVL